ncbi:hypothetical protein [Tianweitania sediminis]|uniref:Uncharacterized protein n=1 Tax=Tianweitania sediminis TaxID=1502156 RepID=A0A8J7R004_9HYPH|nr:hypothetical protein [Tianweitania sediminis]MBP0438512.1 hypothetical protein [Tianweitania sediminis]
MTVQRLKSPPTEAYRFNSRILTLDQGLHGIRYTSDGDERNAPAVMIQALPADSEAIDHMPSPGATPGCLTSPGEMLVLRASRKARIVATIVTTAGYVKNDSLQLKVDRLDAPRRPRKVSEEPRASIPEAPTPTKPNRPAAVTAPAEKPAPRALEPIIEVIEPAVASSRVASTPPVAEALLEASYRPAQAPQQNSGPAITVGILAQGARSWRNAPLHQSGGQSGETIVGLRAKPEGQVASGTQLRLTVLMNDGRTRESVGQDVRIEAMGATFIVAATLLGRTPSSPNWAVLGQLQFSN